MELSRVSAPSMVQVAAVDHGSRYTSRVASRTGWPQETDSEPGTGGSLTVSP